MIKSRRSSYGYIALILLLILGVCSVSLQGWSQPKTKRKVSSKKSAIQKTPSKDSSSTSVKTQKRSPSVETSKKGGKVIEFSQFKIEGTIPRPSAAYLLQRRKLKFRGLTPKKSFLPALFKSVERSPF